MAKFNYKNAKVEADGTVTDGVTSFQPNQPGYHLVKARVDAGGTFTRKVKTTADYKAELGKRTPGTFKWVRAKLKVAGFTIDKSGYNAILEDLVTIAKEKYQPTLKAFNMKVISQDVVDMSNGIETAKTKAKLEAEKVKQERKDQLAAAKKAKEEEKIAKMKARLEAQKKKLQEAELKQKMKAEEIEKKLSKL